MSSTCSISVAQSTSRVTVQYIQTTQWLLQLLEAIKLYWDIFSVLFINTHTHTHISGTSVHTNALRFIVHSCTVRLPEVLSARIKKTDIDISQWQYRAENKRSKTSYYSRGGSAGIVTRLRARRPTTSGSILDGGNRLSSAESTDGFWGLHSLLFSGGRRIFPGIKQLRLKINHLPLQDRG